MQRAANSREDQKKLVKMFKTWEELGFFDSHLLNEISTSLNMHSLVSIPLILFVFSD